MHEQRLGGDGWIVLQPRGAGLRERLLDQPCHELLHGCLQSAHGEGLCSRAGDPTELCPSHRGQGHPADQDGVVRSTTPRDCLWLLGGLCVLGLLAHSRLQNGGTSDDSPAAATGEDVPGRPQSPPRVCRDNPGGQPYPGEVPNEGHSSEVRSRQRVSQDMREERCVSVASRAEVVGRGGEIAAAHRWEKWKKSAAATFAPFWL